MLGYKSNGDIYLGRVRVFIGYKKRPPRWLSFIYAALFLAVFFIAADLVAMEVSR